MLWIKNNKLEFIFLFLIIILTLFLRFYRLDEYMTFLGDEGRDMLVVKKILVEGDFPLLGPPTSVGNMYLGPLYYYMMAIPTAIFWMNPVSPAYMVAVIGTMTVMLIYYLSREWFGTQAAFAASILYSLSPVNIIYSKSSWNPNPAPFFALLSGLGFYQSLKTKNFLWFTISAVSLAFAIQMHYLALILLPVFAILWLQALNLHFRRKIRLANFITGTTASLFLFLLLMSPLAIFDLKYNFMNLNAFKALLFEGEKSSVGLNLGTNIYKTFDIFSQDLVGRFLVGDLPLPNIFISIFIMLPLVWVLAHKFYLKKEVKWPFFYLYTWLIVGLLGLSLYKKEVYDHYLGFLNPTPFLLFGSLFFIFDKVKKHQYFYKFFLIVLTILLVVLNVSRSPLITKPNKQLQRTQEVARFIINQSENRPFNFALISENNYDAAYQFYLDEYGAKPKILPIEKTDQLFVVCEDPVCKPVGHPKHEIAAFGWTQIEWEKEVAGVRIYKLIDYRQNAFLINSSLKTNQSF